MNSLKHGLLARDVVLASEDPSEFDDVTERLMQELKPIGELESELVRNVSACTWRLRRCGRLETGILDHFYYGIRLERAQPDSGAEFSHIMTKDPALQDRQQVAECRRALETDAATLGEAFIRMAGTQTPFPSYRGTRNRSSRAYIRLCTNWNDSRPCAVARTFRCPWS